MVASAKKSRMKSESMYIEIMVDMLLDLTCLSGYTSMSFDVKYIICTNVYKDNGEYTTGCNTY